MSSWIWFLYFHSKTGRIYRQFQALLASHSQQVANPSTWSQTNYNKELGAVFEHFGSMTLYY